MWYSNRFREMALALIATASTAFAGHVYGTLRENNQPLRDARVSLRCRNEVTPPGTTDHEGTYRLYSKVAGACTLEMHHQGRSAAASLYSYDRPTAYDFDLVKDGKGGWELRRR